MPLPVWYLEAEPKPHWTELSMRARRHLLKCCQENIKLHTRYGNVKAILINERRIEHSVGPVDRE
jgi:hypothetical protein